MQGKPKKFTNEPEDRAALKRPFRSQSKAAELERYLVFFWSMIGSDRLKRLKKDLLLLQKKKFFGTCGRLDRNCR